VPQTVAIFAGNSQSGPAGDVVSEDFTVRVLGSDDQPFAGTTVTWAVASGGGSITPSTAVTDASGLASARLTLGSAPGANTATASVSGTTSATFTATAVDPCDFARSHAVGDTYMGSLRFPDCTLSDNTFIDFYGLDLASQQAVEITLTSAAFNAFIFLLNDVETIAADDDGLGVGTDSRLAAILPTGSFAIGANSFVPGTGSYTLSTAAIGEDVTDCEFVWVTGGVNTAQQVTATDCVVTTDLYADVFPIFLRAGFAMAAVQRSTALDAFLELFDASTGALLASDDNGGGGTDAEIVWVAGSNIVVLISASTAAALESGAYTLSVVVAPPQQALASPGAGAGSRVSHITRRPAAAIAPPRTWSRPRD
jgi:hypothetical protein